MLIGLLCSVLGGLTFQPQDFGTFPLSSYVTFTGTHAANFRTADLDGNGLADLVTESGVVFQTSRGFDAAAPVELPAFNAPAVLDLWENLLYLLDAGGRLRVFRHEAGEWRTGSAVSIAGLPAAILESGLALRLESILRDLDGDGTPELVLAAPEGILVYAKSGGGYRRAAEWPVFPPLRLVPAASQPLWPVERRGFVFPEQQMTCQLVIEGDTVSVIEREPAPENQARHRVTAYAIGTVPAFDLGPPEVHEYPPLAEHLRPVRLNNDSIPDFAGVRWSERQGGALPAPLLETWASLGGAGPAFVRRVPALQGFRPRASFVDFDGDGDLDMVTETTGFFDGGPKEIVARFLTGRSVSHTISIYGQQNGIFSAEAFCTVTLAVRLEAPPIERGPVFARYAGGGLFDITGDFDGDGWRDLAFRENEESLAIYPCREGEFRAEAGTKVTLPAGGDFDITDVDGDGRDDILVQWLERHDLDTPFQPGMDSPDAVRRVYLSRESVQ